MSTISWTPKGSAATRSADRIVGVTQAMADALAIRPSQIDIDDPKMEGTGFTIRKFQMRGRFAMRLADYRD